MQNAHLCSTVITIRLRCDTQWSRHGVFLAIWSTQALGNERQHMPLPETSLLFSAHHISESTSAFTGIDRRSNSVTSGAADVALRLRKNTVAERVVGQPDFVLFIWSFWHKRCKYSDHWKQSAINVKAGESGSHCCWWWPSSNWVDSRPHTLQSNVHIAVDVDIWPWWLCTTRFWFL